jgi:hypothetical protein
MSTKLIQSPVPENWTLNKLNEVCKKFDAEYNIDNNTIIFGFIIYKNKVSIK